MWDGDPLLSLVPTLHNLVPSPPCGMVTLEAYRPDLEVQALVPSPPCGMVTGERLGFILLRHSVLSPPCGMAK